MQIKTHRTEEIELKFIEDEEEREAAPAPAAQSPRKRGR